MSNQFGVDTSVFYTHEEAMIFPLDVCYMLSEKSIMRLFNEMSEQLEDKKGHYALEACFLVMALQAVDYLNDIGFDHTSHIVDLSFALGHGSNSNESSHTGRLSFEYNEEMWRHRCLVLQQLKTDEAIPTALGVKKHIKQDAVGETHEFDIPVDLLYHKDFMDDSSGNFAPNQIANFLQYKVMQYLSFNDKTVIDVDRATLIREFEFIGYKDDQYEEFYLCVEDPVLVAMMLGAPAIMLSRRNSKETKQLPKKYVPK